MTVIGWIQILLFCAIILAITPVLGAYMTRVFSGQRTFLSPILRPVELTLYWAGGVEEKSEQGWLRYTVGMLLFHVGGFVILYALLRLQGVLPFNPAGQSAVAPDLSFNTAISFITNTNWQNYGGETTMSYLVQMLALTQQNFLSAATGIVLAMVLIRGFARGLRATCIVPGLAGHAADTRSIYRCNNTRRHEADYRGRSCCLASRHQNARDQRWRLLQYQCSASI